MIGAKPAVHHVKRRVATDGDNIHDPWHQVPYVSRACPDISNRANPQRQSQATRDGAEKTVLTVAENPRGPDYEASFGGGTDGAFRRELGLPVLINGRGRIFDRIRRIS